jgi:hypothetical protein
MVKRPSAVALATLLVISLSAIPAPAATKPPSPQTQAKRKIAALSSDTRKLPSSLVKRKDKAALVRAAKRVASLSRRNPCGAIARLGSYRRLLVKVRVPRKRGSGSGSARGQLQSDVFSVNVALLAQTGARRCGGGAKARATVTDATSTVTESDERHVRLKVALPAPTFVSQQGGGAEYQQMFMQGMGETSVEGQPALPTTSSFVGIPEGANVSVKVNGATGYDLDGVNLYPHQPDPVDAGPPPADAPPESTFLEGPFVKSGRAYRSKRAFPSRVAKTQAIGKLRDLRVGGVDTAGGTYRPKSKKLHVFTSLDVTVRFGGANKGTFGPARRINSPWESFFKQEYAATFVNWGTVQGKLDVDDLEPAFCGEDMLVVTSDGLKPAADKFANARQDAGYKPRVVVVGDAPGQIGSSLAQIQAYILGQLNAACELRPSYVVLFGNTANVPTWHVPCDENGDIAECSIPSDLPYSLNAPADLFADVQLGRIPAPDLASANAVVDKIVKYETSLPAPPGDDFYGHATVTSFFEQRYKCVLNQGQPEPPNCKEANGPITGHYEPDYEDHHDGRGFTKTAETIQNVMSQQYGHVVDRVYTKGDDPNVIPEQYYDGTPLPPHLQFPGFPWNGTGADLLADYNDGRFAILHRDHGWNYGWANPYLTTADTPSLTNGTQLPVVFGVDCSSATFDIPGSPSFVETQVMKPDGGAVAGFGDTQVSPTWPNNHMAYGFFDAPFPKLLPNFGSDTPTKRLGDILLSGKGYMAAKNDGTAEYREHYLYHLLGDPSGQMWSNDPIDIDVTKIDVERIPIAVPDPGGPVFKVRVNMGEQGKPGTVVTLTHNGEPVGRGIVNGPGNIEITPEVATPADGLKVEFDQDGALPDEKAIDQAPSPPAGPTDTTLSMRCPGSVRAGFATTFGGHLDPAFGDAPVKLHYARTGSSTGAIDHTVTTNASGDWTDSVTFPRTQTGQWHITATYDGDASHKPSSAQCDVDVTTR